MSRPTKENAKKENFFTFICELIASIVIGVFFFVIKSDWKYAVLFVSVIGFFMSFATLFKGFGKINRSFCPRCNNWFDYKNYDVTWHEIERRQVGNKVYSNIEFVCVCKKCGHKKYFTKQLVLGKYNKDFNTWETHDPFDWAKDLFWVE